jgi:hypothetical protein
MNKQILLLAFTMFVSVLTVSLSAQPVTHMGVTPKDHVTLEGCAFELGCALNGFRRSLPDGTIEKDSFVIPERYVLVVTDADWEFHGKAQALLATMFRDHQIRVVLTRGNKNIKANNVPVLLTGKITSTNVCDLISDCEEDLSAESNTQMTSGFVVTSDAELSLGLNLEDAEFLSEKQFRIRIRGYLLPVE